MAQSKLTIKGRAYVEKNESIYNALELQKTKEKNKTKLGLQPTI